MPQPFFAMFSTGVLVPNLPVSITGINDVVNTKWPNFNIVLN